MTWFLKNDPVAAPAPPPQFADDQVPTRGEQFWGSVRKGNIEGNRFFTNQFAEADLNDELTEALGGFDNIRPRNVNEARHFNVNKTDYLLERAEKLARMAPEAIGALPINRAQFDAEVTARLRRERDELIALQKRGNAPWTQFAGEMLGSLDWYDLALLPVGGPLVSGTKLTSYVGTQALIGAAAAVPGVVATQAQGERLGFDPGNPVAQVATGAALQGGLAGIIGGVLRIPEYVAGRVAAERAARPAGVDPVAHEAAIDAAEAALEKGRAPPVPRAPALPPVTPDAPPGWAEIRNGIFAGESGGDYDALFGYANRAGGPFADVKLTEMTVDQAIAFAAPDGAYGRWVEGQVGRVATPMGAYQIVGTTLRAAKAGLGLTGDEVMTPALQERLGQWIYRAQGTGAWEGYRGPRAGFDPSGGTYTGTGGRRRMTLPDEVSTPAGTRVRIEYEVVDMGILRPATGDLQPRDRSRAASAEQIAKIAARLDPAQLMPEAISDRGTPLVGPDGIIESGNGRVQGLARAAEINPEGFAAYVQAIRDQGFDVPEGMARPVLIARRTSDLDQAGRIQVIRESNTSIIGRMSATEQAAFDAGGMTQPVFDAYRPGKTIGSLENAGFVQRFMAGMTPEERAPLIQKNGRLSADGLRRIASALFARAFDAKDLLTLVAETESRAITRLVNMLETLAPDWAYFRSMVEAGYVRPEFDITAPLTEAVRIIANARAAARDGQSVIAAVRDRLAQDDMFTPRDPMIGAIIDVFYKGDRARGIEASEEILKRYAARAAAMGRADAADLADDAASPVDVLRRAIADEEGGSPYEPLPARLPAPEDVPDAENIAAAVETFDPARFTDGTASPAVQAADDALQTDMQDAIARARLAPDAGFSIGEGPDKVTRTMADVLDDLKAEKGLIDLMDACRIARART